MKSFLARRMKMALAIKIGIPVVGILTALIVVAAVISSILSTITAPINLAVEAITGFFSSDGESASEPLTSQQNDEFSQCIGVPESLLTRTMHTVPPRTDPDYARGWIMYSLAHRQDIPAGPPEETGMGETDPTAPDPATSAPILANIFDYGQLWQPSPIATSGSAKDIPASLVAIDPRTDFQPYVIPAMVATVDLADREVVTLSENDREAFYLTISETCFSEVN